MRQDPGSSKRANGTSTAEMALLLFASARKSYTRRQQAKKLPRAINCAISCPSTRICATPGMVSDDVVEGTNELDLIHTPLGLQSFKNLLDQIVHEEGDRRANLDILNQYLEAVKPRDTSEDAV